MLMIKHRVLENKEEKERLKDEIEMLERVPAVTRDIPEKVRLFVWRRDNGKCVKCGSDKRLEFDHKIPVVKGGSNTERNIQILCEPCNRAKGATI